jgi:hypothetical protein
MTILDLLQSERYVGYSNQCKRGKLNQSLRQRNKMIDDAIAELSERLVSLSDRLQEIKMRQQQ